MDTVGEYEFNVRSYECGKDGYASLATICNYLQEAASLNAESLKFSKSNFEAAGENISWVLTRMKVRMAEYPKWEDRVSVLTFPRGGRRITAWRDFTIRGADGRTLGVATTEWMLIDLSSRKVVPIPESVFALANTEREPVLGDDPWTPRLRFPEGAECAQYRFKAQNSHIDLNGHVNNVHYIEWLMEPVPGVRPSDIEIVFRSETLAGEEVSVKVCDGAASGERFHCVCSLGGQDHVVARTVCG
jgi:acyl-ACP thioesterase